MRINKKADIMEDKLIGIIILSIFLLVTIGVYLIITGRIESISRYLSNFF